MSEYDGGPARDAIAVTPHDTNVIAGGRCRALYVGGAGNVTLRTNDDDGDVAFVGVTAGSILPVYAKYVRSTGTTATNIVALY